MRRSLVETILGGVVLATAIAFLVFTLKYSGAERMDGYNLTLRFFKAGGLAPGSDVRISGVKVGRVSDRRLDFDKFEAVFEITVENGLELPADTEATIASEGILGGKYLRLIPGTADDKIPPGGEITRTRDFKILEDAVSEIIGFATGGFGAK